MFSGDFLFNFALFLHDRWGIHLFNNQAVVDFLEKRKDAILRIQKSVLEAPLDQCPHDLKCPISLFMIKEPVIAETGQVYGKTFLRESLTHQQICPLTRLPISGRRVQDFPEFHELLKLYHECQEQRRKHVKLAEKYLSDERGGDREHRNFFKLNGHDLIKSPVITKDGELFDKEEILEYIAANGKSPTTGKLLSKNDIFNFSEYAPFIEKYKKAREADNLNPLNDNLSPSNGIASCFMSLFSSLPSLPSLPSLCQKIPDFESLVPASLSFISFFSQVAPDSEPAQSAAVSRENLQSSC